MTIRNIRTCIIKRTRHPKTQLWKFNVFQGEVVFDEQHQLSGRSCYVYPSLEHLQLLEKKHILEKKCKAPVAESVYRKLSLWLTTTK